MSNSADSGRDHGNLPATEAEPDTVVDIAAIGGVTVPVRGGTPVTAITESDQYTGTVSWSPNDSAFAASTTYTATITLTPKSGYTLTGVIANLFTVAGATSVSNSADSGVVTANLPGNGRTRHGCGYRGHRRRDRARARRNARHGDYRIRSIHRNRFMVTE